ncbi:MAG: hypothetical protein JNL58_07765 [Planctomyces sp.]|nr:hypothetical protein [Planctomyces sp.]
MNSPRHEGHLPASTVGTRPEDAYRRRLEEIQVLTTQLENREKKFVYARVAVFLVAIALGCICLGDSDVSWIWMLLPGGVFLLLLSPHTRCLRNLEKHRNVRDFYRMCLNRLAGKWSDRAETGMSFRSDAHPWSQDLDLFGPGSLFQLLNECRTAPGIRTLARWMTEVPQASEVIDRQKRAIALKDELALREALAVVGDPISWKEAARLLDSWVRQPARRIPFGILLLSSVLGIAGIPLVVLILMGVLPVSSLLMLMILQGPMILMTRNQIRTVFAEMDSAEHALNQLSDVVILFENHVFTESALQTLQDEFHNDGEMASAAIRRLSSLVRWLNNALRNQFFAPIAWMGGLLVLLTDRLEHWRQAHGTDVQRWLAATGEFEAAVSIAAFHFEHPDYCLPTIDDSTVGFQARQLGHPLLQKSACVRNDVSLTPTQPLLLVSGSNMSGKSTLLRSIGTNLVLAYCGAVVNADEFRTSILQLATAMRVSDSLQEGRSLFFSVVQRLKCVVDLTMKPRTVLFLLDEILHGTNSHDRRRGAEAVIRSLVDRGSIGLVTTHDLELTRIVETMDGRAENKHFEDSVQNGQMTFDYQLRDGVVQRSNALELMRMLGLDV